jgi:hypothetical protein
MDESLWKQPSEMFQERKFLRHSDAYMEFLKWFTVTMVGNATFKMRARNDMLSTYMDVSLEAFLVVTYMNNYDKWKIDASQEGSTIISTDLSEISVGTATPRWTNHSRGAGKDNGWAPAAKKMHDMIVGLLNLQRQQDTVDEELQNFEYRLKQSFNGLDSGNAEQGFPAEMGSSNGALAGAMRFAEELQSRKRNFANISPQGTEEEV